MLISRPFAVATLWWLQGTAAALAAAAPQTVDVPVSALTPEIEADNSVTYYGKNGAGALLIGNDASAATGGWKAWNIASNDTTITLPELAARVHGRTKVVGVMYDVGDKDVVVSIAATDSVVRLFDANGGAELPSNQKVILGDWSALCPWRSPQSGSQYFYLFGKKQAVQFIVREKRRKFEVLEVQTFEIPVEPNSCAVSPIEGTVYFAADDDKSVYSFKAEESTAPPKVGVIGEAEDEITGLAVYIGTSSVHLLIASEDTIGVYSPKIELRGSMKLTGMEGIEAQGLSVFQAKNTNFPAGLLGYALEADDVKSFAVSSLEPALALGLDHNTNYDPRLPEVPQDVNERNGFYNGNHSLSCFAGFTGWGCWRFTCKNGCSGHGRCVGPNECKCSDSWSGPDCSFLLVKPKYETDQNGGDGDDPAIWISPDSPDNSTVITTTKSIEGAGLSVFDLTGKQLQSVKAGEPNNVDVIYGLKAGDRTIDLAYAACREDNTLCLFEITPFGLLSPIPGGSQPTKPDYEVYGSCAYHSPITDKRYLFVNSKTAEYLQYELTASANGTLSTTLVRSFTGGSGTQVEGCVTDPDSRAIFLGEEANGLWRYDAEPDGSNDGVLIARTGDGTLFADVEGVTLVPGKGPSQGFLIVSCQGVSAFSVFRRAPPHEHVLTFTVGESQSASIDGVTNTDGVAVVGTRLSADFPRGLIVVHDDANQLPAHEGGGTAELASFKLISLEEVLGAEAVREMGLLDEIDEEWGLDRA